jgi:hypothetical protein
MHALVETEDSVTELAREAVKNFRALLPMLNAYVQVMTGNKRARVIMTMEAPRTDGVNVWLRPPVELGKKAQHEKMLCDKRDKDTWLQRCPACAQRELVLSSLFHELAHIIYKSMVPATESERVNFLKQAARIGNVEAIQKRIAALPVPSQFQWLGMANAVSPYFQLLLNALEDVRVNQRMFQARKGTRVMYLADEWRLLREGLERINPVTGELERVKYRDTPLDSQAVIGVYLLGMDIYEDQYFSPHVAAAMQDRELRFLAEDIRTVKSAQGAVNLAFKILVRLRELGFLLEPEERPEPEQDDEPDDPESGESGSNGDSSNQDEPNVANPESGDENNDTDEAEKETGKGDGSGAGLPDEDDDDSSEDQASDEGDDGAESSSASDGSGSDADDADSSEQAPEGEGDSGDDGSPSDSGQASGGSDSDHDGGSGRRDSGVDRDDGQNSSDGGSVPPGPLGEDAGAGRGADRTIEGGDDDDDDDADDEGELTDDLDRSNGHKGSDESDIDDDSAGTNVDRNSAPAPRHGERDRTEASSIRDDDSGEEDLDGGEGADSESPLEAQTPQPGRPDYGTPEETQELLEQVLGHQNLKQIEDEFGPFDQNEFEDAVKVAISQSEHFDAPAQNVAGIEFAEYRDGWRQPGRPNQRIRKDEEDTVEKFMPSESALGPALLKMRRVFADNARGGKMTNQRSGRINTRSLGKRAPFGDDRLFHKPIRVAKKDYFVVIGLDISGSTAGPEIDLIKRAGMAQAELLHRLKIPFAVYAHTGGWREGGEVWGSGLLDAYIFPVRTADQPWDIAAKQQLAELRSQSVNLDGHTIEYYRKRLDEKVVRKETERRIHGVPT